MAELSRTFQAGRMNKDFDERLVPQGEYRDALNLDLSSSEGSDIGALQMLKGNVEYKNKSYNASTETYTVWPDNEYISSYTNAFCIGSIADNTNDKIYWLVGSDDYNCIAEYDLITQVTSPVLVEDKNISNFLNFSLDYLVTGINLLEGYLIWTDNQTEPKQIEIQKFKNSTPTFKAHTAFNTGSQTVFMEERHTTVARLSPIHAPDLALFDTSRSLPTSTTLNYNFALNPTESGEQQDSILTGTEIQLTLNSVAEYYAGDVLELEAEVDDPLSNIQITSYVRITITSDFDGIGTNYSAIFNGVIVDSSEIQDFVIDTTFTWETTLLGEKKLFELKFATYAYRFVYENNQVSAFSPFSEPAFIPQDFDFESYTGYNKGMINNLKKLQIYFAKDLTEDVKSVDLLFKETHNTTVYTVKNIKKADLGQLYNKYIITVDEAETQNCVGTVTGISLGSEAADIAVDIAPGSSLEIYGTSYQLSTPTTPGGISVETVVGGYGLEIDSEMTRGAVEPNQLLRPWDNVPKKALAQEIIGNRIVYGNYTQNYTLADDFVFDTNKTKLNINQNVYSAGKPYKTIKSDRSYQLGIVFKDKYGRETPVFSNETGLLTCGIDNSDRSMFITAGMAGISPKNDDGTEMFEYFKFFIKEPSQEYYNVVADQLYLSPDGYSVWISFPSSEVNKFSEGDHIILKKGHGSYNAIKEENKYKVLAIDTEPPADIAFNYNTLEAKAVGFCLNYPTHSVATQLTYGNSPVEGSNVFSVANPGGAYGSALNVNNFVRFERDGIRSKRYRIQDVESNNGSFRVTLEEAFGSDINFIYDEPTSQEANILYSIVLNVSERQKIETFEEFKGRFFARVEKNTTLIGSFLTVDSLVDGIAQATNNQPGHWNNGFLGPTGQISGYWPWGTTNTILGNYNPTSASYNDGYYWVGGGMAGEQDLDRPWIFGGLNMRSGSATGNKKLKIYGNGHNAFGDVESAQPWYGNLPGYYSGVPIEYGDGTVFELHTTADGVPYDFILARKTDSQVIGTGNEWTVWNRLKVGTKIRFSNHDTIYTIKTANRSDGWNTIFKHIIVEPKLQTAVNPYAMYNILNLTASGSLTDPNYAATSFTNPDGTQYLPIDRTGTIATGRIDIDIIIMDAIFDTKKITNDPAIFETEPDESVDLNLYYEATDSIPIAQYNSEYTIPWFNAYGFGNGVESNRIRDDFNAFQIGKGAKVSTVLDDPYEEENRSSGFIFSQIFNSTSGVNRLNQFIQALPITKDLNPIYGSIQKLYTRDTDLITLCEDKCFRVLANKDALFNADGNTNITGNTAVLGQAIPYVGEFGISTNPESFAFYGFRAYFADKSRGAVIRLSRDGITEISNKGMGDFFADNLKENNILVGSYDQDSNLYNLTLTSLTSEWQEKLAEGAVDRNDCDDELDIADPKTTETTVSFAEATNGWESRKSFIPESGLSINNGYYTFKNGLIWKHGENDTHNNFYGEQSFSTVTAIFNDAPAIVKGFKTIDYVGSRPRSYVYTTGNGINYSISEVVANNLIPTGQSVPANKEGWYAQAIVTDMQEGQIKEFITKENKNFNYIKGIDTFFNSDCDTNISTSEFSVQGIGRATTITGDTEIQQYKVRIFADISCYVP